MNIMSNVQQDIITKIINSINHPINLRKPRHSTPVPSTNIVHILVHCISLFYTHILVMPLWRMCIDYSM